MTRKKKLDILLGLAEKKESVWYFLKSREQERVAAIEMAESHIPAYQQRTYKRRK